MTQEIKDDCGKQDELINTVEKEYSQMENELENKKKVLQMILKKELTYVMAQIKTLNDKKKSVEDKMKKYELADQKEVIGKSLVNVVPVKDSEPNSIDNIIPFKVIQSIKCLRGSQKKDVFRIVNPFKTVIISIDIGGVYDQSGDYIGVGINADRIVFSPGETHPRGALRIHGLNYTKKEADIGFVPKKGQLYNFKLEIDKNLNMIITIKDSDSDKIFIHNLVNRNQPTMGALDISLIIESSFDFIGLFNNLTVRVIE